MSRIPSILVVDDEPSMRRYLRTMLEAASYKVEIAKSGHDAVVRLQQEPAPDLVLLDLLMPSLDGLQTLERLRQIRPQQCVVMLSCVNDSHKVVYAMRLGAYDYLTKPLKKEELDAILKHCLQPRVEDATEAPAPEMEKLGDDIFFLAASPSMRKIRAQAGQVAHVDVPVLLLGESGTGKEVVARLIHKLSPTRAHRTFLKVNCAALPGELLESELFGYEPGAFTGATRSKPGKFEWCNKGTILLDEFAEMPVGLQAKLLHVLQDQQFERLGGLTTINVDVRILAATNVDIPQALAAKTLRSDLYYRLNAFTLHLPPLRDRREEIPILLRHFMMRFADRFARAPLPLSPTLLEAARRYSWPGNLRELENFVKRYLILGNETLVLSELETRPEEGPLTSEGFPRPAASRPGDLKLLVRGLKDKAEMEAISQALEQTNWNRKQAARLLNISYKALLYKIRQYGIDRQ